MPVKVVLAAMLDLVMADEVVPEAIAVTVSILAVVVVAAAKAVLGSVAPAAVLLIIINSFFVKNSQILIYFS